MQELFHRLVHVKRVQASTLNDSRPRGERRGWKILRILYPALTITLFLQSAIAQERIGYVFDINGEWVLSGHSATLARSDSVPAGGIIRFRQATFGNSYIVIANRTGKIIFSRHCDREDCSRPVTLPRSDAGYPSALSRVFSAVMSFWHGAPEEYDASIPRAGGILEESIILLEGGKLDLGSVFKNKSNGRYLLRFVSKGRPRQHGINEVAFDWNRVERSPLAVPTMKPGLYEIQLLSLQDRERLEPGEEVWVLIMPPGREYEITSTQFAKVLADTSQWNAPDLEESRRSFLRAYLGYLNVQKKR